MILDGVYNPKSAIKQGPNFRKIWLRIYDHKFVDKVIHDH